MNDEYKQFRVDVWLTKQEVVFDIQKIDWNLDIIFYNVLSKLKT